ncbi:unnamed protein product [Spodoptera exigua]|nr:unnamed protein product [Spodoptera exigua]
MQSHPQNSFKWCLFRSHWYRHYEDDPEDMVKHTMVVCPWWYTWAERCVSRQQHYIELTRRRNNAYIDISTYFLFEKDNKVPSCEDADKQAATQRRSTAVARNAQRSARLEITLHRSQPPAPRASRHRVPLCIVRPRRSALYFCESKTTSIIARSGSGDASHNASR